MADIVLDKIIIDMVNASRFGELRGEKSLTMQDVKGCMKIAITIALQEAAEDAEIHYPASNNLSPTVDKQSIINVLNKIK